MPLPPKDSAFVPEGTDLEFSKGPQKPFPSAQAAPPTPSALDVAAAAFRTANVASAAWEHLGTTRSRFETTTDPDIPGYDPVPAIPKGYEQFGDRFLDAHNPQQVEDIRQRIQQEESDRSIIARAGGWGVASTFAAGLSDPLSIASMAIPVGGATRLAQAGRLALVGAGTTAAQEFVQHQVTETRTAGESLLNIGASAVLSGVLGAAITPRLTKGQLDKLLAHVNEDGALGPPAGTILDTRTPSPPPPDPEAANIAHDLRAAVGKREAGLRGIVEGEEGQRAAALEPNQVAAGLQSWIERRDKLAASLMEDKGKQVAAEAERLKSGQGVLESLRQRYATTNIEPIVQERAAANVAAQRTETQAELEAASEAVRSHQAQADLLSKVQGAEVDLEQHLYGVKQAEGKGLAELAQTLPEGQRGVFEKRLAQLEGPAAPSALPQPDGTGLPVPLVSAPGESTVGAAKAAEPTMAEMEIAPGARALVAGPGRVAPGTRLLASPSLVARKILAALTVSKEALMGHAEGLTSGPSVEALLWRQSGAWQQALDARNAAFKTFRDRIKQEGGEALSRREFGRQVAAAMRRGDEHAIPEVADAAKQTRATVFQPLFERAKKLGLISAEDLQQPLFAESYLMRQYDRRAITSDLGGWTQLLREHFVGQGVDRAEADSLAYQVTRNVMGSERGTMDWKMFTDANGNPLVGQSGRLTGRTLSVPDKILEPYLNSDIDHITHSYIRTLAPEVEMTERFGSRDLASQIQDLKDEYAVLTQRALAAGDNAKAVSLGNNLDRDIRDISAIRDRLYGIHGQPQDPGSFYVRAGRLLRQNNVLRLLGGATLSHIPDIANVIMRYGLPQTLEVVSKLATSMDAIRMARADAHRFGVALDMSMNTISMLGDFGSHSQYLEQRIASKLTRAFTIGTGETPFITLVQNVASVIGQHEILNAAENAGSLDKNLAIKFAQAGLDRPMLDRIATEAATNGREVNGLKFGMSDIWKDQEAARAFEAAIVKDAHSMTLRPSVGDTPLLMSKEVGKLLLQFKTFAFAAQRTVVNPLMQGLVRGDPRSASALLTLMAAGAASYMAKQSAAGQPIEWNNPGRMALEILDKSNLMGWTADVIYPTLNEFGFKDLSRWSDRDPVETLLGPSVGTLASTYQQKFPAKALASTEEGEKGLDRSDLHFLRRTFVPGQNLWYFRRQLNNLEDSIGDMFNLPGKSNQQRAAERAQQ